MMNFVKNFAKDEDGAVSIDWVVLTAAIVMQSQLRNSQSAMYM